MKRLNLKKKKMFESVYVCRDSVYNMILVIPARVGIVKIQGCVQYYAAIKNKQGEFDYEHKCDVWLALEECKRKYSSYPDYGTAWLVEEGRKYINWTRVDQDMHLLNADGSIVTSKS